MPIHSVCRHESGLSNHRRKRLADAALAAVVPYALLGVSLEGALWFNCFAACGELFYHSNFKPPRWLKYFIQTRSCTRSITSSTSIIFYYAGLPIWDRLFGGYRDADTFAPAR